jgi:hypothetical protein
VRWAVQNSGIWNLEARIAGRTLATQNGGSARGCRGLLPTALSAARAQLQSPRRMFMHRQGKRERPHMPHRARARLDGISHRGAGPFVRSINGHPPDGGLQASHVASSWRPTSGYVDRRRHAV